MLHGHCPSPEKPIYVSVQLERLSQIKRLLHGIEFPQVTLDDDPLEMARDGICHMRIHAGLIRQIIEAVIHDKE